MTDGINLLKSYVVQLKGTATSFAGFASLSVIRDALVTSTTVLTEQQVAQAVAVTRTTPEPGWPLCKQRLTSTVAIEIAVAALVLLLTRKVEVLVATAVVAAAASATGVLLWR